MTLHEFNTLPKEKLSETLYTCCGSNTWVKKMLTLFPMEDLVELLEDAEEKWYECSEKDWLEAFKQHPKIGDTKSLQQKFASTAHLAVHEQSGVSNATNDIVQQLQTKNEEYEKKFGYIFIVCATGKSAEEILTILQTRLANSKETEIKMAADEQNKITKLRLENLLN